MKFPTIPLILACAMGAASAQEQSTKPGFVGTWNNPGTKGQCEVYPHTLVISFAGDRLAIV